MEVSLYGDQDYGRRRMDNGSAAGGAGSSVQQLKRRLTLDLETTGPAGKRPRASQLLTSPDLKMLKLGSPELERLIAQQGGLVTTPTPGGPQAVSAVFGRAVTEEQEDYARGFVDALHSLKARDGPATTPSSSNLVFHNLDTKQHRSSSDSSDEVRVKEEPQRVPSAPGGDSPLQPGSPVNLVHQEAIKLERKRMRNRIAATKCRQRKLERIARLEDRVAGIKKNNQELTDVVTRLREQVAALKQEVRDHTQNGCQIMYPQQC